ncbi:MAG TPA: redoxin domain-containing protein [Myxococcales bacterium]|nr:redoxin domain-containing protein [Myxococcales bacterium]
MAISRVLATIVLAAASAQAVETLSLTAADGARVTLDQLRAGRDATVIVFWSATCPCVRRYQERVDALLDAYPGDRVRVVAVSSNAGERFADALGAAKERGVRVPLYRDEGGRVADAFGAKSTPTVVVLDAKGEMRFRGWIDNERKPGDSGREPWLDRALAGLLEGKSFESRSPVYGCRITRSLRDPPPEAGSCCAAAKKAGGAP